MANRIDTTGDFGGIDERTALVLARLSAHALERRAHAGVDDLEVSECAQVLEALAWPAADTMERVALWLGQDYEIARRRARRLRDVLEACGSVALLADPTQTGAVLGAVQRLAYHLGALVQTRSDVGSEPGASASQALAEALQRSLDALPVSEQAGLLLVHCAAIDRVDALRGLRASDALARSIAQALRHQVLRASDALHPAARDEFACLLHPVTSEGVAILAAQKVLRVLDVPLDIEDFSITAEPRIGVALFPEHGKDAAELLQRARAALRNAHAGHDRIALYAPDAPEAQFDESRYAARLRLAIHSNSLQLHYQPQADFASGRIIGAEALLRWSDEELGAVPPNIVVKVAESTGMMNDLTMWVIGAAIQQCAAFRREQPEFTVSVNISPSNLHEADLPHHVGRALRTWDVSAKGLIFEVTETAILSDQKLAMEALNELKRLGVNIAIDDFGTGYSSLYYLAQMPLDELKIDIMFVRQMLELPQHAKIVRSLIDLAHNLELTVVAEGVENEPIWSALQHLGCERAQGWYVGKPVPAGELMKRLREAPVL